MLGDVSLQASHHSSVVCTNGRIKRSKAGLSSKKGTCDAFLRFCLSPPCSQISEERSGPGISNYSCVLKLVLAGPRDALLRFLF